MTTRNCRWWIFALSCVVMLPTQVFADDGRFVAVLQDGTRVTGDEIQNWHDTTAEPSLSGQDLLNPEKPFRWIRDGLARTLQSPDEFVEFVGGDLLPGRVVGGYTGRELLGEKQFPFLTMRGTSGWDLPSHLPRSGDVRVLTHFVRRIVWQRRADQSFRPGTLFFRDGRQQSFRAVRWNTNSVTVLEAQQTTEVPFDDIAELHLSPIPAWDAYVDTVAMIASEPSARMVQWETTEGMRLTGSTGRFQAWAHGNRNDPNSWYHLLQPAWSLDPFWVWHRKIVVRRSFQPHQPPLTILDPVRAEQGNGIGEGWGWKRDFNSQGGVLESGDQVFGWGFGVHAPRDLEFLLPPAALSMRVKVGLDRIVGRGGCVKAVIQLDDNPAPLFASDVIVGSSSVIESGDLRFPSSSESRTLKLTADMAHTSRPSGADPFNIRDVLDWLEPELTLDAEVLASRVRERTLKLSPPWQGWQVAAAEATPVQLLHRWDITRRQDPRYVTEIGSRLPFLTWTRSMKVSSRQAWLVLGASRFTDQNSHVQVLVNGMLIREFDVPLRNTAADPDPLVVSLQDYAGEDITLEVLQLPSGPQSNVYWKTVAFVDEPPGERTLFADEASLVKQLHGEGNVRLDRETVFSGSAALRVAPGDIGNPTMPGMRFVIREHPRVGEFRYLSFAWRKQGGTQVSVELAHDGEWGDRVTTDERVSFRYDAGTGDRILGNSRRIANRIPEEWVIVTRDLYGDFGDFTLTGLVPRAVDGEAAWIDRIVLGRTTEDLRQPQPPRVQPFVLIEDQFELLTRFDQGNGQPLWENDKPFSGSRSLKVAGNQRGNAKLFDPGLKIRRDPGPDEYRFVRFAWKKPGGPNVMLQFAANGEWRPKSPDQQEGGMSEGLRYQAGPEPNSYGLDAIVLNETIPTEWTVVTRDLFADFGEFNLTGVSLCPQNGEPGEIDHLYLGRTLEDLDQGLPRNTFTQPAVEAP